MADRTRALKLECPREGGNSLQLDMGPTEVDPTQDAMDARGYYVQNGTSADAAVFIDRTAASLRLADGATSRLLAELVTSVQGGVNYHGGLADIVHWLANGGPGDAVASGAFEQRVYSGPLLSSRTWYTSSTLATKVYSVAYAYIAPPLVSSQTMVLYASGVAIRTVVDSFTYSGPLLTGTTRSWN